MKNSVSPCKDRLYFFRVPYIQFVKNRFWINPFSFSGKQIVYYMYFVAVGNKHIGNMRTDEPRASCNYIFFLSVHFLFFLFIKDLSFSLCELISLEDNPCVFKRKSL